MLIIEYVLSLYMNILIQTIIITHDNISFNNNQTNSDVTCDLHNILQELLPKYFLEHTSEIVPNVA